MPHSFSLLGSSILAILVLVFGGCATTPARTISSVTPSMLTARSKVLVEEILSADSKIEPEPHSEVPIEINESVERWIDYFSIQDRARFARFLERGLRYRDLVEEILKENEVPAEMYYLAMIESGYVTHARSRAQAVGAWQFIRATGRRYGLRASSDLDERRDIVRSTRAACRYLKDLHDEFGSWYLALAAYNAGEGRIRSAIRRGGTRDFWALVNQGVLPRETMDYVPKFLAALIIGKNLKQYGFEDLTEDKLPSLKGVAIPSSVHLRELGKAVDLPVDDLREYNPHLTRGITPRGVSSYEVWVPSEKEAIAKLTAATLARSFTAQKRASTKRKMAKLQSVYRVRRGDTLHSIAQRYRLSVSELKRLNRMKQSRIFLGQALKVSPGRG